MTHKQKNPAKIIVNLKHKTPKKYTEPQAKIQWTPFKKNPAKFIVNPKQKLQWTLSIKIGKHLQWTPRKIYIEPYAKFTMNRKHKNTKEHKFPMVWMCLKPRS